MSEKKSNVDDALNALNTFQQARKEHYPLTPDEAFKATGKTTGWVRHANDKRDFAILTEGSAYMVPEYRVQEGVGLVREETDLPIVFVRGSRLAEEKVEPVEGTLHEHLLSVISHDLDFKHNLVPSEETERALYHVNRALEWLEARAERRKAEGTLATYKK